MITLARLYGGYRSLGTIVPAGELVSRGVARLWMCSPSGLGFLTVEDPLPRNGYLSAGGPPLLIINRDGVFTLPLRTPGGAAIGTIPAYSVARLYPTGLTAGAWAITYFDLVT